MRVAELKALGRERGLRGYSRMRKPEIIELIRNNQQSWAPDIPPRPNQTQSVRFKSDRPRQPRQPRRAPTQQEMDIFEQQEMSKSRPQVKNKLNDWYDWLVNQVPKTVKDKASRAFKIFKDKIIGLYNGITGSAGNQAPMVQWSTGAEHPASRELEPIELEQAFNGAYRSYRINGRPRMDVETFFHRIRGDLIDLIKRELNDLNSARVQTTTWIRFVRDDEEGQEKVELAFNSLMASVYRGSDLDQIADGMIASTKFQIENPALLNCRFRFDEVLYLDINFHWLNLTRGTSYLPLPDWIEKKKAIINPHNNDEECFKWAVIAALEFPNIKFHPERISNLTKFPNNYDWSGLKFPVSIKDIGLFEINNDISINVLAVEGREFYIHRKSRRVGREALWAPRAEINLLFIHEDGINHYTAIKSLSRLLSSKNSNTKRKQHFCINCLQGFTRELSRDQHQVYCEDNETVRVEMPREGSTVKFCNGQNQFKVSFIMYADLESILEPMGPQGLGSLAKPRLVVSDPIESPNPYPNQSYIRNINQHVSSGWCVYSKFAYSEVKDPLKMYRGKDCVKKFCDHVIGEAHRLYHAFPEKPMEPLTKKQWKKYKKASRCHICFKSFTECNPKVRDHCHYSGL